MNEIEQFDSLKGNGKGNQQFQIICLTFDPNNRYGQTRVGIQSVTEKVQIRFNWNATTTIGKGKRYFAKVLSDGPISRINFCTIPPREIASELPVYGEYDEAFDEELKPYIENLCSASGLVDCPEAFALAKTLLEENADFSALSQNRVFENLSFRANVIAYLKACVLTVAQGEHWDKTTEDFIRWSERYDLWCKMFFFGNAIERAEAVEETEIKPSPMSLLETLPEVFTLEDVVRVRTQNQMSEKGTRNMLFTLRKRHHIEFLGGKQYRKTGRYKSGGSDLWI